MQKKEARVKNMTTMNRHKKNKMVSTNLLVESMVVYITGLRIVVLEITFEQLLNGIKWNESCQERDFGM